MKYKVETLEGALLDAAVAKAEGFAVREDGRWRSAVGWELPPQFSSDWRVGGPVIEREGIDLHRVPEPDLYNEWKEISRRGRRDGRLGAVCRRWSALHP